MRIDAVGRARHQGTQVPAGNDLQLLHFLRLNHRNPVHFIRQRLVQDGQVEDIPYFHRVQVAEQPGAGQSPVSAQHAVGGKIRNQEILLVAVRAAGRQRCARDMADRGLQHGVCRSVVQRQVHVDFGNRDISHIPGAVGVQLGFIVRLQVLVMVHQPAVRQLRQPFVVVQRSRPDRLVFFIGQFRHALGVAHNRAGLMQAVPVFAEGRIRHNHGARQENQNQHQVGNPVVFLFSLFPGLFLLVLHACPSSLPGRIAG